MNLSRPGLISLMRTRIFQKPVAGLRLGMLFISMLLISQSFAPQPAEGAFRSFPADQANVPPEVRLSLSPRVPWVKPGETVTFALYVEGNAAVSAAEVTLNYGRDLELVEVKPGPYLGVETIAGPSLLDPEQGQATFAWARIGETPSPTPPGALAFITVKAAPGYPWNTWFSPKVKFADANLRKFNETTISLYLHVYHRLPAPTPVLPSSSYGLDYFKTGSKQVFTVRTYSPGTIKYRIEVSQDRFQTILRSYDQTGSQEGWDKEKYQTGEVAEFASELASSEPLEPGVYQWRAYAWVEEVGQWGEASRIESFQVQSELLGVTQVSPLVLNRYTPAGSPILVDGWGFSPGATVNLVFPGSNKAPLESHRESDIRITGTVPVGTAPGLVGVEVARPDGATITHPMMVMPPTLYRALVYFPRANQIIPGREFPFHLNISNAVASSEGMALVSVRLPNRQFFELVRVKTDGRAEVLRQEEEFVLLAVYGQGSDVIFMFRLSPDLVAFPGIEEERPVALGEFVDFDFRPVVVGSVSQTRWNELESRPLGERVQLVQQETEERLEQIAQTFNNAPPELLELAFSSFLTRQPAEAALLELLFRLQGHGLAVDRIIGLTLSTPDEDISRLIRAYRYYSGIWP